MALHRTGQDTRRFRRIVTGLGMAALGAGCAALARLAPSWAWALAAAVVLSLLARRGCRIISPAIIAPQYEPPAHEIITHALGSLGIPGISKAVKGGGPGSRSSAVTRDGPGWGCQIDLPRGGAGEEGPGRARGAGLRGCAGRCPQPPGRVPQERAGRG